MIKISSECPPARARSAAILAGYGADRIFGDPASGHPVAGFGRVAAALEARCWQPSRSRGAFFVAVLVGGAALAGLAVDRLTGSRPGDRPGGRALVLALFVWAATGGRSLEQAGSRLAAALERSDLPTARALLPCLAGRDAADLDAVELARAGIESVAENTADAVTGALFWGAVAGAAGVAAYRAANTLDAMVGHRSARYEQFGWAAARLDDVAGWVPARLAALLAVLLAPLVGGAPAEAWAVLRRDGAEHPSPNAGRLEAAFAGALGLTLGGTNRYGDRVEHRPRLGGGRAPGAEDLRRAVLLSRAAGLASALVAASGAIGVRRGLAALRARMGRARRERGCPAA